MSSDVEISSDSDHERFEDLTENDVENRSKEIKNKNTIKSDKKCEKIFMKYLKATGNDVKYWLYDPEDLDRQLGTFWFAVRTKKEKYTVASLKHIRYAIRRCLKK